jgi:hypothetical protein
VISAFTIIGGADAAQFQISQGILGFTGSGVRDFEVPADSDGNNEYAVVVRASDQSGRTVDQTITVTVTNVATETGVTERTLTTGATRTTTDTYPRTTI